MDSYFPALIALSLASLIEGRFSTPGLRPSHPAGERAFWLLGKFSLVMWLMLLAWGFWKLPWWQPVAGVVGSLGANALQVQCGPRPGGPGLSMALAMLGLFLAARVWFADGAF